MSSIQENLERVRSSMEAACLRSGRPADSVKLLAVTKYVSIEQIQQAVDAGIRRVGENRVQEMKEKLTFLKYNGLEAHLIGQLQTNKIKYVCGKVDLIQSLDRFALAEALENYADANDANQAVLIQVNIGDEPQKGGVAVAELDRLAERICACPRLSLRGLMCVPPALSQEETRPYFAKMRSLFERSQRAYPDQPITELSMGMSHDFETAIEEGATMVRVGSAIFGARNKF